jgi:tight adherence protein C
MNKVNIYILILIAPALIYSIRIILIEIMSMLAISNLANQLDWLNQIIRKITRTEYNQQEINEELNSMLQMLSIMVSAGESPMSALKYVSRRSNGVLPSLISESLEKFEDGKTITQILDLLATTTRSPQVRRLTNSIQIAIIRGTPILDVFNNQILAINKLINFNLMKLSGRSEIALLIPVVFLILPISISFAVWPSIYGLNQAGF